MDHVLAPFLRPRIQELASAEALLAFDFDGTLAPIVPSPREARMKLSTRRLLVRVAQLYPVAVISGRPRADLRELLGPVPVWDVVGNDGLEPCEGADQFAAQVRAWLPRLRDALGSIPGLLVEDKGLSVGVHYRAVGDKEGVRAHVRDLVAQLGDARLVEGKQVFNVFPRGAPTKGDAFAQIWKKRGATRALYVGDDETDEDVFAHGAEGLMTVVVGARPATGAAYYLHDQDEVDALLSALAAAREQLLPRSAPHRSRR